ncbi:hypothetical protein Ddye_020246 [Dipteronia dyeriana]|uniref:Uncharacterized protein n=1 Tax=Dipteronia dyeriana TaxID=168575 RepID=A0AAD9U070_9ROSI|nr:hypothetical protein Ddye_020246 [Dipteronia dyeriana]
MLKMKKEAAAEIVEMVRGVKVHVQALMAKFKLLGRRGSDGSGGDGGDGDGSGGDGDGSDVNNDGGDKTEGGGGGKMGTKLEAKGHDDFRNRFSYHAGDENRYPVGQLHRCYYHKPNVCSIIPYQVLV